jgi:hypothetical protein
MKRALLLSLLVGACSQEPVVRNIKLEAEGRVPSGSATVDGDAAQIALADVESLRAGYRFVVWGIDDTGAATALGAIAPEAPNRIELAPGAKIAALEITEELDEASLPAARSNVVWLRGSFPGELRFALGAADYSAASGSARISDDSLEVVAPGLPALPSGFEYVVWLGFAGGSDTSHAHLRPLGGDHESGEALRPMGTLPPNGTRRFDTNDDLFEALECRITIESLRGVSTASTSVALHGEVELPEGAEDGEGHLH